VDAGWDLLLALWPDGVQKIAVEFVDNRLENAFLLADYVSK